MTNAGKKLDKAYRRWRIKHKNETVKFVVDEFRKMNFSDIEGSVEYWLRNVEGYLVMARKRDEYMAERYVRTLKTLEYEIPRRYGEDFNYELTDEDLELFGFK